MSELLNDVISLPIQVPTEDPERRLGDIREERWRRWDLVQ